MTDKNQKSPNIRINKVYTRTGDSGKTRLIGGKERDKDDPRIETYGTVDELNSHIGLCREMLKDMDSQSYLELIKFLHSVQNDLFNLGTQIASPISEESETLPKITVDAITKIEDKIDIPWIAVRLFSHGQRVARTLPGQPNTARLEGIFLHRTL